MPAGIAHKTNMHHNSAYDDDVNHAFHTSGNWLIFSDSYLNKLTLLSVLWDHFTIRPLDILPSQLALMSDLLAPLVKHKWNRDKCNTQESQQTARPVDA